ncbi:MAG: nucleoside triphosphate pyrophosphohydrolase [Candidatus Marinimicrobia bacterium]|nr:nucleoside triphosphate pyrophosphohydrolase [Candidatus Neomarinimicrobiota bacterium]
MKEFDELLDIIRKLRGKDGCPWDKKQDAESLIPYFIEEIYEVIDAIDNNNYISLQKELGDVLLHVGFQMILAEEKGEFIPRESLESINKKMITRHPHVFGNKEFSSQDKLLNFWEKQKLVEGRKKLLDGIPETLPSLHRALRIQEKVATVGFEWDEIESVVDKIDEEILELKQAIKNKNSAEVEDEFGDLLFTFVNISRYIKVNPDEALRKSTKKFVDRFNKLEKYFNDKKINMQDVEIEELERIWHKVKKENLKNKK